jgi:hypothetical protein
MKKLKIKNEEVSQLLDAEVLSLPKYATQLIIDFRISNAI